MLIPHLILIILGRPAKIAPIEIRDLVSCSDCVCVCEKESMDGRIQITHFIGSNRKLPNRMSVKIKYYPECWFTYIPQNSILFLIRISNRPEWAVLEIIEMKDRQVTLNLDRGHGKPFMAFRDILFPNDAYGRRQVTINEEDMIEYLERMYLSTHKSRYHSRKHH